MPKGQKLQGLKVVEADMRVILEGIGCGEVSEAEVGTIVTKMIPLYNHARAISKSKQVVLSNCSRSSVKRLLLYCDQHGTLYCGLVLSLK